MKKMFDHDLRHLLVKADGSDQDFAGLISIRDTIKFTKDADDALVHRLEDTIYYDSIRFTETTY